MSTQIIEHASRTRCYKCGSTQVEAICHHCGRAMCTSHVLRSTDATGKLLSVEFTELGLKDTACGESPLHCERCNHSVQAPSVRLIVVGILITLTALAIPIDGRVRLIGILIGGGLAVYGYYTNRRRIEGLARIRPPLPLLPRFNMIQIRETLRGKITLDSESSYQTSVMSAEGTLSVASSFGKPERDQLQQYRKKYHVSDNDDVQFHAGFVVLRGPAGLKFSDDLGGNNNLITTLTDQVSAYPFLSTTDSRGSGEWHKTRRYSLIRTLDIESLPIRLVPSLIQETAQRALDLEVQWTEPRSAETELTIHRIGSLELRVPVTWGQIESVADSAVIGQATDAASNDMVRTITWRGLLVTDAEHKEHRRTFSIRFEEKIDLSSTIRGRLDVTFKSTLSHLEGVDLYYPLGGKRETETSDIATQVIIDFELSLAGLRYQDIRVVPDPKKDTDKQETLTFEGVIPDHNTVIALTNAMSNDFYVKRVIENPPRTGEQANVINRYWDIAGRHYLGVYPIDYHLILAGEAVYGGAIQAHAGTTKTTLTVQGAYANPDMEVQIENVWERLNYLIRTTLEQLPHVVPSASREGTQPQPSQPQVSTTATANGSRIERIAALHKRLDQLLDLLIAGRLSEETFLGLKAETEQELQALQANT